VTLLKYSRKLNPPGRSGEKMKRQVENAVQQTHQTAWGQDKEKVPFSNPYREKESERMLLSQIMIGDKKDDWWDWGGNKFPSIVFLV